MLMGCMRRRWGLAGAVALVAAGLSCGAPTSNADLIPAGPPDVLQVFVTQRLADPSGSVPTYSQSLDLDYGTNPHVNDGAAGTVATAVVSPAKNFAGLGGQQIRVIFDELLEGTTVEEFGCACGDNWPHGNKHSLDPFDCGICGDDTGTPQAESAHTVTEPNGVGHITGPADRGLVPGARKLSPNGYAITCRPVAGFAGATQYRLTGGKQTADQFGGTLPADVTYSFRTN